MRLKSADKYVGRSNNIETISSKAFYKHFSFELPGIYTVVKMHTQISASLCVRLHVSDALEPGVYPTYSEQLICYSVKVT